MIDFSELINKDIELEEIKNTAPPQLPVTIIDLDRATDCYDMNIPMADPCPACGGFRMLVGDWVCWGFCYGCYKESGEEA